MKRQTFSTRRKENIRKKLPFTNTRKGKRQIEEPCKGEGKICLWKLAVAVATYVFHPK
jgi:hypothetical protein